MPTPDPRIEHLLEVAGFGEVAKIRHFKIDDCLIMSLVERWIPETHTFHLPVGECTVTLEDVALQLGLGINGKPVTGPTFFDWDKLCYELLGFVPPKGEALVGSSIKLKWLRDRTIALPDEPTKQQLLQHCRAYILGLISGDIMPNKLGNKIHLMYLALLADLERA
uniref:Serine/threonine protein phosphatase 7 long form isogeny n=1 Tax=Cajanus cajan TaxID=3821 RepID=A0A151QNM6_CAJCA|nr:Serine/threonine protein phosphatase 7 long form isogeny [Cajanus cajan]KYP41944.1 Serine/threonine protein phosphatase 7 long form isogeny [Cajanus cajan]